MLIERLPQFTKCTVQYTHYIGERSRIYPPVQAETRQIQMVNVTLRGVGDHVEINGCNAGPQQRSTDLDYCFSCKRIAGVFACPKKRKRSPMARPRR